MQNSLFTNVSGAEGLNRLQIIKIQVLNSCRLNSILYFRGDFK